MAEALSIRGGRRLCGEVTVSGGKNAAVAIVSATLLANSPCTIENLPNIDDIKVLIDMLRWLGADVAYSDGVLQVDPRPVSRTDPPYEYARKMRASYYLAPVLLGRLGCAEVPLPGGCNIGSRPIDQTIKGMTALGAAVQVRDDVLHVAQGDRLAGSEVYLDMPSVGATINTMLTAVSAPGNTTIYNAAKEPHVVDTANFLSSMGAWIKGAGTDIIRIRGGRPLHGTCYAVIPDQIETGTLMIAAAATQGDVTIRGVIPTHMESLSAKLMEIGVRVTDCDDVIRVSPSMVRRPIKLKTQVYPGFPTDLQQPMTALLSLIPGESYVSETIYENRFRYIDELRRMGARIDIEGNTAHITGVSRLMGTRVAATDLRAGAAMIVAGLTAEGETLINGLSYIRRGYEHIDQKLRALGAEVHIRTDLLDPN